VVRGQGLEVQGQYLSNAGHVQLSAFSTESLAKSKFVMHE